MGDAMISLHSVMKVIEMYLKPSRDRTGKEPVRSVYQVWGDVVWMETVRALDWWVDRKLEGDCLL